MRGTHRTRPDRRQHCDGTARRQDSMAQKVRLRPHRMALAPRRPMAGIAAELSDAELAALAVISALLGHECERGFVRFASEHLRPRFAYLPDHDGCNKRLRRSGEMISHVTGALTRDWHDDVRQADSTPVPCGASRPTLRRSGPAGWTQDGRCASHSRWFWGLRLHIIVTPAGLPVAFALAGAKADERRSCADMIDQAAIARPGQTLVADNRYRSKAFEADLNDAGITLMCGVRVRRPQRARLPQPTVPAAAAPDSRIGHRHPQRPAHPRTPQRPHPSQRRRTRPHTHPRPHRRLLAQPNPPPPPAHAITHPLRPPTPRNQPSRCAGSARRRPETADLRRRHRLDARAADRRDRLRCRPGSRTLAPPRRTSPRVSACRRDILLLM